MRNPATQQDPAVEAAETREWLDSLDYVLQTGGVGRAAQLLRQLDAHARQTGARLPFTANTPYVNTIPAGAAAAASRATARSSAGSRASSAGTRMAMVVRANQRSRTASAATSRPTPRRRRCTRSASTTSSAAATDDSDGDIIYFQGHASPGIYARAFLEGRLDASSSSRTSAASWPPGGGLSSYPHPWLMPDFWEFPTVSMGLGPIMAIYQARFNRYLEDRGLKKPSRPEGLGVPRRRRDRRAGDRSARSRSPSREKLDNLIFVINCNLQRLDGPVRGNGKIIQELEAIFRGAGWNVIKVHLGQRLGSAARASDNDGLLVERMGEVVDGQYQKYAVEDGAYIREHFFGADPRLLELVEHLSDERAEAAAARRPRSGEGLRRLQGGRRAQGRSRRSSSRRRSRATASARRARARTSRTSRRS